MKRPRKRTNEQIALDYYIDKGFSPEAAAGIVGTLRSESSLNPDSINSSSGAYGIALWLGPRLKALFQMYGKNPTFENQLDFTWHEMNNTHKNALKYLKAAKTAEDAAKAMFGYYEFMAGPEKAIAEMDRWGLNGKASLALKILFANDIYKNVYGGGSTYAPVIKKYGDGSNATYDGGELPEVVVTGHKPSLTLPSIKQSQELAMSKALAKSSGFNPDALMWEQYAPTYRPLMIPGMS